MVRVSLKHFSTISEHSEASFCLLPSVVNSRSIHFEAGDVLTETVMQPPCHLASFLILQGQNSTTQAMSGFFGTLGGGYMCVDFQPSDGLTVLISHCSSAACKRDLKAVPPCVMKLAFPVISGFDFRQRNRKLRAEQFVR
jgi:hypothetical protein